MTLSDIRTLTISSVSMLAKEQNLLSLSLALHTLYVFPLCRNHTGCNKHTLIACFSLSCNLLLALRAMRVTRPFIELNSECYTISRVMPAV